MLEMQFIKRVTEGLWKLRDADASLDASTQIWAQ